MFDFTKFQNNAIAAIFACALSAVFIGASVIPAETATIGALLV